MEMALIQPAVTSPALRNGDMTCCSSHGLISTFLRRNDVVSSSSTLRMQTLQLASSSAVLPAPPRQQLQDFAMALAQLKASGKWKKDSEVYARLLRECTTWKTLEEGQRVHAHIIRSGFKMNIFLQNTLMNMYMKCGSMIDACKVFDAMPSKNIVSWNIIIAGYAKYGEAEVAFQYFKQMLATDVTPSRITFISVLKGFSTSSLLERGRAVHDEIVANGLELDLGVANSLLEMYAKCGSTSDAGKLFQRIAHPDEVSWHVLIVGYATKGELKSALDMLHIMAQEGLKPRRSIYFSILSCCHSPADLEHGTQIHADLAEAGLDSEVGVCNCLIDMYAKCGTMVHARRVFEGMDKRDAISWTSLIAGYARQGQSREAIELFKQMGDEAVKPTVATFVAALKACTRLGALDEGKHIHLKLIDYGFETDAYLMNCLLEMYAKCGCIEMADKVFGKLSKAGVVPWNMMIAGYAGKGLRDEAFRLFEHMKFEGVTPDSVTFASLLKSCSTSSYLEKGKLVHSLILESGVEADVFLGNTLVRMYINCDSLSDARKVFDDLPMKNLVSWNIMIGGYAKYGIAEEAFALFEQMKGQGICPDQATFASMLRACATPSALKWGRRVHDVIEAQGVDLQRNLGDNLINMYIKCGSLEDARLVSDKLCGQGVFVYTMLIGEYARRGLCGEAIVLFKEMILEGVIPTQVTCLHIISACSSPDLLEEGKQIHELLIKVGYESDVLVVNALMAMYAECGDLEKSRKLFDGMSVRDAVSWNTLIGQYVKHGSRDTAFRLFGLMETDGVEPDKFTFSSLLKSCTSSTTLGAGRHLHVLAKKAGLLDDLFLANTLLEMYVKCGSAQDARQVFDSMCDRNVVSWNTMLGGYVSHEEWDKSVEFFWDMQRNGPEPDKVTFLWILQACASPTALELGQKVHADIIACGLLSDIMVATAVVDMYCKCGSLLDAREVFENMPEQDVVLWNAMIAGYSSHREYKEAFELFREMLEVGWEPDRWTFVSILDACISPTALDDGRRVHALVKERGFEFDVIVSAAIVDMYGKCGSLEDAFEVFKSQPFRDVVLWTTMIGVYAKFGYEQQAFTLFWKMYQEGIKPDKFLFVGILNLCANTAALKEGKRVHWEVVKHELQSDIAVGTALIDMYARCGQMNDARKVFDIMPHRDNNTWRALVAGYSRLGHTEEIYKLRRKQELSQQGRISSISEEP